MPSYLIYAPKRFPEVLNAVLPLGETVEDMPNLIAVRTEKDIDDVTAIVREAAQGENTLIVEAKHAQYKGDGTVAKIGALLDR